eukprot:Em0022g24a
MQCDPFRPGDPDHITVPASITRRGEAGKCSQVSARRSSCFVVRIPARIGLSVKNMATFGPGKAGGGGIGFPVSVYSSTRVTTFFRETNIDLRDVVCRDKRGPVIQHHVGVFRKCLSAIGWGSVAQAFSVHVHHSDAFPAHCGLGSTSGAALGTLHGMNYCLGEPFTREEVRQMLAVNYVEEHHGNPELVSYGYETTMTAVGANGGGFFVIQEDSDMEVLARNCQAFKDFPVFILFPDPDSASNNTGHVDEVSVLTEGAETDTLTDEAVKKSHLFMDVLVPQLSRGPDCDIAAVGAAVSALQLSGGKRVEVMRQPNGPRIVGFMDAVRVGVEEAVVVGMSSVGPAIAVVCKPSPDLPRLCDKVVGVGKAFGIKLDFQSTVNTTGLVYTEQPLPKYVVVIGKPGVGKSTICAGSDMPHLAAGGYLRGFLAKNHDSHPQAALLQSRAAIIRDIMSKGEVMDRDNVTATVLLEELCRLAATKPDSGIWLLDGFPRSDVQLRTLLDEYRLPVHCVVRVSASDEARRRRCAARTGRGSSVEPELGGRDMYDMTDSIAATAAHRGIRVVDIENNADGDSAGAAEALLRVVMQH